MQPDCIFGNNNNNENNNNNGNNENNNNDDLGPLVQGLVKMGDAAGVKSWTEFVDVPLETN